MTGESLPYTEKVSCMVESVAWQFSAFLLPPSDVSFTLPDDLCVSTSGEAGARYGHSIT